MSVEALARVHHHVDSDELKALLELQLPPKVYDLAAPAAQSSFPRARSRDEGSAPPRSVSAAVGSDLAYKSGGENYKQRIERLRSALSEGFFAGKRAEHRTLMQLYDDVVHRIHFGLRPNSLQGDDGPLDCEMRSRVENDGQYDGEEKTLPTSDMHRKLTIREGRGKMVWPIRADLMSGEMLGERSHAWGCPSPKSDHSTTDLSISLLLAPGLVVSLLPLILCARPRPVCPCASRLS